MILDPDYGRVFTQARIIAWQYGYACVAHGSYTRDLDLLLVPWTTDARGNDDQLLKLIADSCGLHFRDGVEPVWKAVPDFTEKPNGRRSCSLFFKDPRDRRWVDVSVIPCTPKGSVAGNTEYASWAVPDGVQPTRQLYECAECSQPDCTWRGECDGESCPACGGNVVPVGDGAERIDGPRRGPRADGSQP